MPLPKFNFIPEAQLKAIPKPETVFKVTLAKNGQLQLSREYTSVYDLEGKFVRLYADAEKKVLGWSIIEHSENLEQLDGLRLLKKNATGSIAISVGRLLQSINYEITESLNKVRVHIYKSPLHAGEIHYVNLK